jgi:hypothetical protein
MRIQVERNAVLSTCPGQGILDRLRAAEAVMIAATTHLRSGLSTSTAYALDAVVAAYGRRVNAAYQERKARLTIGER